MNRKVYTALKLYEKVLEEIMKKTPDFNKDKNSIAIVSSEMSIVDGNIVNEVGISTDREYLCIKSPLYDFCPYKIVSWFAYFDGGNTNLWYRVYILNRFLNEKNMIKNMLTIDSIKRTIRLT